MTKPALFNCVSEAVDMLDFSTHSAVENAGCSFHNILVTWSASPAVLDWLKEWPEIIHVKYRENRSLSHVQNLRRMMSLGFDACSEVDAYIGMLNTDMFFGEGWLEPLFRNINHDTCTNSTHITPLRGSHVTTANLGPTIAHQFDHKGFDRLYQELWTDEVVTQDQVGWKGCATLPYLFHRDWWKQLGPWHINPQHGYSVNTPDRQFFERCYREGLYFIRHGSSIVYHTEKVERQRREPTWLK